MITRHAVQKSAPLVIALGVVAVAAIVAFGQGGKKTDSASNIQVNKDRKSGPTLAVSEAEYARKTLVYYTGGVKKDLFSAPEPPKPKEEQKPAPPPTPPAAPPVVVNPFADYVYAGTVTMGDRRMALIENTKTKEGLYLAEGESFMGGKISQISDRMVTVDVAGAPQMIAKRDDFKLTPLDKSAPFLSGAPAQGAPAQAGQPAPGTPAAAVVPGGPGGPGGRFMNRMQNLPPDVQARIQERINNMSPEERQRREERMNRWRDNQFEGRGRGERGRGDGRRERRNNDG